MDPGILDEDRLAIIIPDAGRNKDMLASLADPLVMLTVTE
jgi:hypothetical protein